MSFGDMATLTISTKRLPAVVSGKRSGIPATYLTNVNVFPVMPPDTTIGASGASTSVVFRSGLNGQPIEILETYLQTQIHTKSGNEVDELPDIRSADIVVSGSIEYAVKFVSSWPLTNLTAFLRVVLEENK